jgi:hypothetical protein
MMRGHVAKRGIIRRQGISFDKIVERGIVAFYIHVQVRLNAD